MSLAGCPDGAAAQLKAADGGENPVSSGGSLSFLLVLVLDQPAMPNDQSLGDPRSSLPGLGTVALYSTGLNR
jgi:hypothetical protein